LATLASIFLQQGHVVRLRDCPVEGVGWEGLESLLREFVPDFVVINTATPTIVNDLRAAALAKGVCPAVKTIAIGIHPSALPGATLKLCPDLDAVCIGEPERAVPEWVGGKVGPAGAGVLSQGDRDTGVRSTAKYLENLDELPFPAWQLVDRRNYRLPFSAREFLLINVGRGCPQGCLFCAARTYYGNAVRLRSVDRVIREMKRNAADFAVSDYLFWAESFTQERDYAASLCEAILKERLDVRWVCNARVDQVDGDLLRLMKRAGCWMIGYGVESLAEEVLRRNRKNVVPRQIEEAVVTAKAAGLAVMAHCVFGLPGETEETLKVTESGIRRLPVDFVQYYTAVPFPGSELYAWAVREGRLLSDDFVRFEQNSTVLRLDGLPAEKIAGFRRTAYLRFYLRPRVIWNVFRLVLSRGGPADFLRTFFDFGRWAVSR